MKYLKILLVILLVLLGVSFAMLNAESVSFNYYVGKQDVPLSLLLVGSLILGILLSALLTSLRLLRLRHQVAQLRKRLDLTEKEVTNLRAIPLKDNH